MTPIAMTFLVLSVVLVWGGLAASVIALARTSVASDAGDDVDTVHRT